MSLATTVRLTVMLARPSRQGRAALVLPIVAFGVTTALLLVVVGGVRMFFTDPRAAAETEIVYRVLSALALVLLTVPIATLGAAAARLSARRRNDRLATLRLLGAGAGEVSAMTVVEAGATALVGGILGVGLYAALLPLVGLLPFFGGPVGAGALWTGAGTAAGVVVGVVVVATASAALSLRRVQLTPLGVARRTDPPRRRTTALIFGVLAIVAVVTAVSNISAIAQVWGAAVGLVVLMGLFGVALLIVNVVGTPLVAARGRSLARTTSSPARLIAGRELSAHAASAWRRVSGIAMIAFIAVVGGSGASLVALAGDDGQTGSQAVLFADMRTGVLVTLGVGFALLACSVGVTQAASTLEDRELIVGLDRLGMPGRELRRARALTVMVPLRWAAVGGALVGGALALPVVGMTVLVAPVSLAVIVGTFVAGILLVRLSLLASRPLVTAIRRAA
ncbi:FtsX-like permease family protein [uncultured Microbacterium sp.]|uniref:FtsX-like permease family protein n=1 Tax=uncultured Microbacterium sp. TaxID=191216 RepID=UPI0025E7F103|nr:FtsX-like permease family protein [uncultured Microbacterium sp.]